MDTTNEPVAMRYDFDGYGYQYIDSGSGSDWQTRVDGEPLYTHPSEHDLGIAEAIGFDKGYKAATAKTLTDAEFDNIFANGKRLGVLETEDRFCKAKTLTDEEIITVLTNKFVKDQGRYASTNLFYIEFARAILKKASEK